MARQFSYPSVAALEVDGVAFVSAPLSEVKRKTILYGDRNNKRFTVTRGPDDERGPVAVVRREAVQEAA